MIYLLFLLHPPHLSNAMGFKLCIHKKEYIYNTHAHAQARNTNITQRHLALLHVIHSSIASSGFLTQTEDGENVKFG